jgi:hypothetical protein
VPSSQAKSDAFARLVAANFDGPVVRYSKRLALLRAAERAGIPRLVANLVIARVQHETRGQGTAVTGQEKLENRAWLGTLAVVTSVQGLIIFALWWIIAS